MQYQRRLSSRLASVMFRGTPCTSSHTKILLGDPGHILQQPSLHPLWENPDDGPVSNIILISL